MNGDRIGDLAIEVPKESTEPLSWGGYSANICLPAAERRDSPRAAAAMKSINSGYPRISTILRHKDRWIVTLPDGLQYQIITKGKGTLPTLASQFTVNDNSTLTDGTVFDSSASHGGPATFGVDGLVSGFSERESMQVGDHGKTDLPSNLAYGTAGNPGAPESSRDPRVSPPPRLISRTPCVARPMSRIPRYACE